MSTDRPVRTDPYSIHDLGRRGWNELHELARLRGRLPRDQVKHLILFALHRSLTGEDVELSKEALEGLFADDLEYVA
jgi:hypothetical protein